MNIIAKFAKVLLSLKIRELGDPSTKNWYLMTVQKSPKLEVPHTKGFWKA